MLKSSWVTTNTFLIICSGFNILFTASWRIKSNTLFKLIGNEKQSSSCPQKGDAFRLESVAFCLMELKRCTSTQRDEFSLLGFIFELRQQHPKAADRSLSWSAMSIKRLHTGKQFFNLPLSDKSSKSVFHEVQPLGPRWDRRHHPLIG